MYELNICHLYPNLLNLYGDRGNIFAIQKRCDWRNISVNIHNISIGDEYIPENYDITFLGGGQDFEQEIIQKDLLSLKGKNIIEAINNNKVFLAICGGYQLLGKYYKTWDGKQIDLLGAIDIWTIGSKERLIGNFAFECDFLKSEISDGIIVGFENHSGRTYLGDTVAPLGKILVGNGNNSEDKTEGAIFNNVFCSYSHGSLLPKNPIFTDYLITIALKTKYPDFSTLSLIDDTIENLAKYSVLKNLLI